MCVSKLDVTGAMPGVGVYFTGDKVEHMLLRMLFTIYA